MYAVYRTLRDYSGVLPCCPWAFAGDRECCAPARLRNSTMPNSPDVREKDAFDPKTFLGRIDAGKTIERYGKNQKIFSQGDVADSVFFIRKGKVKITVLSEHGKEAVVGIFGEGQFFGEGCLRGGDLRSATSHAMEECLITSITRSAMLATLSKEPKFSAFFMAYLLRRNSRIEDDLIDQLFNSSERRLARLLLLLANFGENDAKPIAVTLSQE